jgi:hypothetical protein
MFVRRIEMEEKMSKELKTVSNTGKNNSDLQVTSFMAKDKPMIQLTQGFGGCAAISQLDTDEVGFIQLSILDAYKVIIELTSWIKIETERKAAILQEKIEKDKRLQQTIFEDAVECQHFIDDLKMIEIPLTLLGD